MIAEVLTAVEVVAIGLGGLAILIAIGVGLTELLVPAGGLALLLAPAVGLAVLSLGFQWLTFFVPPYVAALAVLLGGGSLTAIVAWRRRPRWFENSPDLAAAGAISLFFFVFLLQMVIRRGFLTVGGFPSDNVFIYVQAAQYLLDHPAPSLFHAAAFMNPGSRYLLATGPAFPNSVGSIDAAASVLTGLPVHALFDPINALGLAITVGPVWVFVRRCLDSGRWIAAGATALFATNQLMYWVIGNGFQQESMALPMFTAGVTVAALGLRAGSPRAGAVVGLLGAALVGVYLPVATLMVACATGCAVVGLAILAKKTRSSTVRLMGLAALAGTAGALPSFLVLINGGLVSWQGAVGTRVPAGGISEFPALPYVTGALPFVHNWAGVPYGRLDGLAVPLLLAASAVLLLLPALGLVWAVMRERAPEVAILGAGLLFVLYELAIARYPYGFVKSVGYLVPLTCAFTAYGAVALQSIAGRLLANRARALAAAALAFVLIGSLDASRDMVSYFVNRPASFPTEYLGYERMQTVIPAGSSVFVDLYAPDYATLVKAAAIAYFLPDRNVRVFAGDLRSITFENQAVRPRECAYDYVVTPGTADDGFVLVYSDQAGDVKVYKRQGPGCGAA